MAQAETSICSFRLPSAASGPALPECFDITAYLQNRGGAALAEEDIPNSEESAAIFQMLRLAAGRVEPQAGLVPSIKQPLLAVSMKRFFVRPLNLLFLVHTGPEW